MCTEHYTDLIPGTETIDDEDIYVVNDDGEMLYVCPVIGCKTQRWYD
jgi:hypothetical protein